MCIAVGWYGLCRVSVTKYILLVLISDAGVWQRHSWTPRGRLHSAGAGNQARSRGGVTQGFLFCQGDLRPKFHVFKFIRFCLLAIVCYFSFLKNRSCDSIIYRHVTFVTYFFCSAYKSIGEPYHVCFSFALQALESIKSHACRSRLREDYWLRQIWRRRKWNSLFTQTWAPLSSDVQMFI